MPGSDLIEDVNQNHENLEINTKSRSALQKLGDDSDKVSPDPDDDTSKANTLKIKKNSNILDSGRKSVTDNIDEQISSDE